MYVNDAAYYVGAKVYTWSDPENMYDTCETYYFHMTDSGYNNEISAAADAGKTIAEKDADALWIKYESTGEADKEDHSIQWGELTYSDVYKVISEDYSFLYEIVE